MGVFSIIIIVYTKASFMKLRVLLNDYEDFESLENVEKSSILCVRQ